MIAGMNAPARQGIPFRPDRDAIRRAGITALMRTATAHLLGAERRDKPSEDPVKIAQRMFPNDRDVALLTRGAGHANVDRQRQRAADDVDASTSSSRFRPSLLALVLLPKTLQLTYGDGAAAISVPAFVASASGAGYGQQGAPIPVHALLASATLPSLRR